MQGTISTDTAALARRIEQTDGRGAARVARALGARLPELAVAVEEAHGAVRVWAGPGSPLGRVRALGLEGPVDDAELDALCEFYRSRGGAPRVELCTFADPSAAAGLAARGFRLTGFVHVLARRPWPDVVAPSGAWAGAWSGPRVRRVAPAEALAWGRLVARGFGDEAPSDALVALGAANLDVPGVACFAAEIGGEPCGGGAVSVDEGLAFLYAGATLPTFRRRGVQAALVAARVAHARAAGAELVAVAASAGSVSERNLARLGFELVHGRAVLEGPG